MMHRREIFVAVAAFTMVAVAAACPGERCSPDTCNGCCSAQGVCELGSAPTACGRAGAACVACSASEGCVRQRCVAVDGGELDGGVADAGPGGCLIDGRCGAQVCNLATRQCEPAAACTDGQPQPAECGPGLVCRAGQCLEAPRPTCDNFGPTANPRRFDPISTSGPVLYEARALSFLVDDAGCPVGSTRRGVVQLDAYDRLRRFGGDGGLPRLFVYRSNMIPGTVAAADLSVVPSDQGQTARIVVETCAPESVTVLPLGYAFEGGNGICVTLMR